MHVLGPFLILVLVLHCFSASASASAAIYPLLLPISKTNHPLLTLPNHSSPLTPHPTSTPLPTLHSPLIPPLTIKPTTSLPPLHPPQSLSGTDPPSRTNLPSDTGVSPTPSTTSPCYIRRARLKIPARARRAPAPCSQLHRRRRCTAVTQPQTAFAALIHYSTPFFSISPASTTHNASQRITTHHTQLLPSTSSSPPHSYQFNSSQQSALVSHRNGEITLFPRP